MFAYEAIGYKRFHTTYSQKEFFMNFFTQKLRTLLLTVVLTIGAVCLSGCGGSSNSPSEVVKVFQAALIKGDMETVGKNCTPEMLGVLAQYITQIQTHEAGRGKMAIAGETINGDKATVDVKYENGESDKFGLVKADGKWKVCPEE